jgi:hypothetical protein
MQMLTPAYLVADNSPMLPERLEVFQRRREDEAASGAVLLTKLLLVLLCAAVLIDWIAR